MDVIRSALPTCLLAESKIAEREQNCALAQILHICSMHIESLIDRCYMMLLFNPQNNTCFSIFRHYVACFDALCVIV